MFVTKNQQKQESHTDELSSKRQKPASRAVNLLQFSSGKCHYAVEMSEMKQVIRDLISIQACTPRTVTTRLIKKNRGQTIVFNLESCLNIQQCTSKDKGKTSMLILNETMSGSRVGILVPGIPEIQKRNCPRAEANAHSYEGNVIPVRGIIRDGKPGNGNTAEGIALIDIRSLVDNCIVRLKGWDSERVMAQSA